MSMNNEELKEIINEWYDFMTDEVDENDYCISGLIEDDFENDKYKITHYDDKSSQGEINEIFMLTNKESDEEILFMLTFEYSSWSDTDYYEYNYKIVEKKERLESYYE